MSIAFANELSMICDEIDINVWELIDLANKHPRVNILSPGPGVGGHCIAVDPWFIINNSPDHSHLIKMARTVNEKKPKWVLGKFNQLISKALEEFDQNSKRTITVACYGLSFKPDIDDLRESPAVEIVAEIIKNKNLHTLIVEPHITSLPEKLSSGYLTKYDDALSRADFHILLVDHSIFKDKKPQKGVILDTKGIWD